MSLFGLYATACLGAVMALAGVAMWGLRLYPSTPVGMRAPWPPNLIALAQAAAADADRARQMAMGRKPWAPPLVTVRTCCDLRPGALNFVDIADRWPAPAELYPGSVTWIDQDYDDR